MTIDELLAAAGLTANDEIPIWDAESSGEPTKKITAQQLAAAVVTLAAVARSGDTMTGNLKINRNTSVSIQITSGTGITLWLLNDNNGKHGIYSDGYWDGAIKHNDGKYLICRKTDGSVAVADHYNKSEVDARAVLFEDILVGNSITIGAGGYYTIPAEKKPSGKTIINAAIQNFGSTGGALSVTANGAYIMGVPNTSSTNVKVRYYYRG